MQNDETETYLHIFFPIYNYLQIFLLNKSDTKWMKQKGYVNSVTTNGVLKYYLVYMINYRFVA